MAAIYSLFWEPGTGETFINGSLIDYQDHRTVRYRNPLLSPSRIIHAWHQPEWEAQPRPAVPLPLLIPGETYQFFIDADVEPAASVGLAIDYFDRQGQRIGDDLHAALAGTLTLPAATATYRLSLITLNNEQLTFRSLLLGPAPAFKKARVGWPLTDKITNIDCYGTFQEDILDLALVRQRFGVEALPLPLARHQVYLRLTPAELADETLGRQTLTQMCSQLVTHFGAARVRQANIRTAGLGTVQAAGWLRQLIAQAKIHN